MPTPQGPNPGLNTNHELLLADAEAMQTRFKLAYADQTIGGFFFRNSINDILVQERCIGLRYYFTIENDILKVIFLGVEKATFNDLFNGIISGNAQSDPPYSDGVSEPLVNQSISLIDATALTAAFRTKYPTLIIGGFFFRSILDNVIDLADVKGLRYKFGINDQGRLTLIINPVGTDFYDMDIYNIYSQRIRGEMSNGGGGGGTDNPLTGN